MIYVWLFFPQSSCVNDLCDLRINSIKRPKIQTEREEKKLLINTNNNRLAPIIKVSKNCVFIPNEKFSINNLIRLSISR